MQLSFFCEQVYHLMNLQPGEEWIVSDKGINRISALNETDCLFNFDKIAPIAEEILAQLILNPVNTFTLPNGSFSAEDCCNKIISQISKMELELDLEAKCGPDQTARVWNIYASIFKNFPEEVQDLFYQELKQLKAQRKS